MLFKGSRYAAVPTATLEDAQGRTVRYLRTRFIPDTGAILAGHVVDASERLDHVAFRHFRDTERFWRICDANVAMRPDDLVAEPGRILRIPSSEE
jgi:hypothetical protein